MASSLRDRLNALSSAAPKRREVAPSLLEYRSEFDAEDGLFSLPAEGLRRMAFEGGTRCEDMLFLDTETTGLSGGAGTVAFLVGLGRVEGRSFVVYQYLMPHYGLEPLLLDKTAALIAPARTLVTFNGRSFDVPLLRSRFTMCRMPDPTRDKAHWDLIHPARRAWKLRLRDCSLGHIESQVLGFERQGDVPGSEAPGRYFDFLKTGDMALLDDVVSHNRQDIVSLGALLCRLCRVYAAPTEQTSMLDVLSLGKALEKRGERDEAGRCYRLAGKDRPLSSVRRLPERRAAGDANKRLSLMLRSQGDTDEAERVWRDMIARRQMGVFPYVELAKRLEHGRRDYAAALDVTERAFAVALPQEKEALEARRRRLTARLAAKNKRSGGV